MKKGAAAQTISALPAILVHPDAQNTVLSLMRQFLSVVLFKPERF